MINKEEVLYGRLAVMSGFIDEDQFRVAVESKRQILEERQARGAEGAPTLDHILRAKGFIDDQQHHFLNDKLAVHTPKELAGYEILKKLGQGAMGAVYKAKQKSMDRIVALKVLSRDLKKNRTFIQRFEREAQIAGQLNHPNIVGGIDRGIDQGIYYYVMEYVEGKPLDRLIEDAGKLEVDRALEIALQMARALEHAHSHGLVHRDVKPENILINDEGVAKLCDLGLAKPEDDSANLTQIGTSMGTPHYISPEQALGRADIDIRSDIYSLGTTLWSMVIGDVPFRAETPALVLAAHIDKPLPDPKVIAPYLPTPLCRLLKKMLAKSPDDRHKNPTELIAEIEAVRRAPPTERKLSPARGKGDSVSGLRRSGPRAAQGGSKSGVRRAAAPSATRTPPARRAQGPNATVVGIAIGVGVSILLAIAYALSSGGRPATTPETPPPKTPSGTAPKTGEVDTDLNERLGRLDKQLLEIAGLAADPVAYEQALARYDTLKLVHASWPVGLDRIGKARAMLAEQAEAAAKKALGEIEIAVTGFLGEKKLGEAMDALGTFPAHLRFTATGQSVLQRVSELDRGLAAQLAVLLESVRRLEAAGTLAAIDDALSQIKAAIPTFDKARRTELKELVTTLGAARERAHTRARDELVRDVTKVEAEIARLVAERRFEAARALVTPLEERRAALGVPVPALATLGWDLALLAGMGAAFSATATAAEARDPATVPADRYLATAAAGKDASLGARWPLAVAVLHFHERRYEPAKASLDEATAAGQDGAPLAERLATALAVYLEEQAAAAWPGLEAIYTKKRWPELVTAIAAFRARFAGTDFAKGKAETLAAWEQEAANHAAEKPEPPAPPKKELGELLHGKIHAWDAAKRVLDIEYRFEDDKELADFALQSLGGQLDRFVASSAKIEPKGSLAIVAPAGYDHVVVWTRPLAVTVYYQAADPLISGVALLAQSPLQRYLFGFDFDNPFKAFGGGGRFGGEWPSHKSYIASYAGGDWRVPTFLATGGELFKENTQVKCQAEIKDDRLLFTINNAPVLAAKDAVHTKGRVSLVALRGASFARLRIKGTVEPEWLKAFIDSGGTNRGAAPRLPGGDPPGGDPPPGGNPPGGDPPGR